MTTTLSCDAMATRFRRDNLAFEKSHKEDDASFVESTLYFCVDSQAVSQ